MEILQEFKTLALKTLEDKKPEFLPLVEDEFI